MNITQKLLKHALELMSALSNLRLSNITQVICSCFNVGSFITPKSSQSFQLHRR